MEKLVQGGFSKEVGTNCVVNLPKRPRRKIGDPCGTWKPLQRRKKLGGKGWGGRGGFNGKG